MVLIIQRTLSQMSERAHCGTPTHPDTHADTRYRKVRGAPERTAVAVDVFRVAFTLFDTACYFFCSLFSMCKQVAAAASQYPS